MGTKIGIIGCGAIGGALAKYASQETELEINSILLFDVDAEKAVVLANKIEKCAIKETLRDLIASSDLVIEAASPSIVPEMLSEVIENRKNLMIMSIGGLLNCSELLDQARKKELKILLPSGAIAGLDALKAFSIAGIDSVILTTRKGPRSLVGAPFIVENKIDVDTISKETVIFDGNVKDAVIGFPKNVNVSALLALAGIGPVKTNVRIITSPEYKKNTHEIQIVGNAGKVTICCENVPFPENPKTSYSAALAAMASLKQYFDTIRIGT